MGPSVTPMLHAVWALNQLDEATGFGKKKPKRNKLLSVSQWGDVRNCNSLGQTIAIPLDKTLSSKYFVGEADFDRPFAQIEYLYLRPAIDDLALQYEFVPGNHVAVARLEVINSWGVQSFRADYNDLSVRCKMQYDMDKKGVYCELDMLLGSWAT